LCRLSALYNSAPRTLWKDGMAGRISAIWTAIRMVRERARQERSRTWTRAALMLHQDRETALLRRWALARSPFYRRFHAGKERAPVADLPILSKATMMESFDDLVTDRSLRLAELEAYLRDRPQEPRFHRRYVVLATSGSTGRRGVFVFDRKEWIRAMASIARPILWVERQNPGRRAPRAAIIASGAPWHYSARIGASLGDILPSLRLDAGAPIDDLVRELNRWQPAAIAIYPSTLSLLADKQLAGELRIPLAHIASSAELLTAEVRDKAREVWGAQVRDTYGATEYAPLASECEQGQMHLLEDGALIEAVDAAGRPVPEGEIGERLLLTVFRRFTQPLIRYEISDRIRITKEFCPCGRPYRVMKQIEGRIEDTLLFPSMENPEKKIPFHPSLFADLLERIPLQGWQVIQEVDALRVLLLGTEDERLREQLRGELWQLFRMRGAAQPRIEVHFAAAPERGPTGKAPLIVCKAKSR
jgi:phenylacetate-CoA ligase